MADKKEATRAAGTRKRGVTERERLARARDATDSTAPTRAEIAALLDAAESARDRLEGDARLLRCALEKDRPDLRAVAHGVTADRVCAVTRICEGLGTATALATRIYLIDHIEQVVALLKSEGAPTDTPSVRLRRTLVHADPAAYIRARLAVVAPDIAKKATDDVLAHAIAACAAAGPGEPGSAKWDALSDMWFAISGVRVAPKSMSAQQAIPSESREMKR